MHRSSGALVVLVSVVRAVVAVAMIVVDEFVATVEAVVEVLVVVVSVERAFGTVNTREESEQEVEGTAEPG